MTAQLEAAGSLQHAACDAPPTDWAARVHPAKVTQEDAYGCGAACLAMVAGVSYDRARAHFVTLGLGAHRRGRPPLSTNTTEMAWAIASIGLLVEQRPWRGWDALVGLAVLKVRDDWRGAKNRWHWAVAVRHPDYDVVVLDPHGNLPAFRRPPLDVLANSFERYSICGRFLQVEQGRGARKAS